MRSPTGIFVEFGPREVAITSAEGWRYRFRIFQGHVGAHYETYLRAWMLPPLARTLPEITVTTPLVVLGVHKNTNPARFLVFKSTAGPALILEKLSGPNNDIQQFVVWANRLNRYLKGEFHGEQDWWSAGLRGGRIRPSVVPNPGHAEARPLDRDRPEGEGILGDRGRGRRRGGLSQCPAPSPPSIGPAAA